MLKLPMICLSLTLLSGCSSIVSERIYPVSISSNPSEADFILQNRAGVVVHTGKTPETVTLKAGSDFFKGETYQLIVNKKGYDEKNVEIDSSIDAWYFGNILILSGLGLLFVDPYTGAMFTLPETANAKLNETTIVTSDSSLTVR